MSNDETPHGGTEIPSAGFVMLIERLTRIETTLESIRRDRDEMQRDMQKSNDDHESRIRGLERWKYMLPSSLITAVIAAAVTIYGQIGK